MATGDFRTWLHELLRIPALTQSVLARHLDVTHAALNRWINGRASPRPRNVEAIRNLHLRLGWYARLEEGCDIAAIESEFNAFKGRGDWQGLLDRRRDLHDEFLLRLTFHSNGIEGSTLTLRETQAILFDNRTIAGHPLREHLEVANHRAAFLKMLQAVGDRTVPDPGLLLDLHRTLMNGIIEDAGSFRAHAVRIVGSRTVPPNPAKVAGATGELCAEMRAAAEAAGIVMQHARFEAIHPFADGNGRVGRLILNLQMLRAGFPCLVIRAERKSEYYDALEKAQVSNVYSPLLRFCLEELGESSKLL